MVRNPKNRYLYEKVRQMRERGYTYNEIQDKLKTSKSNISLWVQDIKPSGRYLRRLQKKIIQRDHIFQVLAVEANRKKYATQRENVRQSALQEIKSLDKNAFMIAGAILYWAEGVKSNGTAVANSDPNIILFMVRWFNTFFGIPVSKIKIHLHIHYGNDEGKIKKYWSKLTGVPLQNFGKSFIKPKGTGHRTHILPNGIVKIRMTGAGVEDLRRRILGWTEKIYLLTEQFNTRP